MQLTTLALNLIISERLAQRAQLAQNMKEIIECEDELSPIAEVFKNRFLLHINRCVETPNCSSRLVLFGFADFWNSYFKSTPCKALAAA